MTRVLEPELLDELPASDPRALRSRRDLRRINWLMGNARVIAKFVREFACGKDELRIAEIGAGDGNVSLCVARSLKKGELILVDRNPSKAGMVDGWDIRVEREDVFDWLKSAPRVDVMIANLFLHHFERDALGELLKRCAECCDCFVGAEPRRSRFAEWFAGRVGLIGCNEVTRHDAVISVRAGFCGEELSALWIADGKWNVREGRKGLFAHFFSAVREQPGNSAGENGPRLAARGVLPKAS
jgi:hypothetical protein